jgi:hypothetical protein
MAGGRPRTRDLERQERDFVKFLNNGVDPLRAAQLSGHSAERALKTLSELGFVLGAYIPQEQAA